MAKKQSKGPALAPHAGVGRKPSGPALPPISTPAGKTGSGRAGNIKPPLPRVTLSTALKARPTAPKRGK
jgi:hypothetical protein